MDPSDMHSTNKVISVISEYPMQKIWLTGSILMHPKLIKTLFRMTCMHPKTLLLQENTDRPNIAHHILPCPHNSRCSVITITCTLVPPRLVSSSQKNHCLLHVNSRHKRNINTTRCGMSLLQSTVRQHLGNGGV